MRIQPDGLEPAPPRRASYYTPMSTATTPPTAAALATSLNQVLADSYALMSLTHLAHWNVEGQGFFALHTAFQTQYEELFLAIDTIAERVRSLDAYAIGGLGTLAATAGLPELSAPLAQEAYVQALIEGACREVVGRVGTTEIRPRDQDLARQAVVWHVAADIAAIVLPNGTEDATGMYQVHSRNYAFTLAELISQARMPTALDVL